MKKRSEADSEYIQKLEDIVTEDNQWEQMFKETTGEIGGYVSYKGRLADNVDILYTCLLFDDRLPQKIERLYVHTRMRSDEDTTMQRYQDMFSRAQMLPHRTAKNSSFPVPEILSMDRELLERYMVSDNGIGHSKRALEIVLARRDHILSVEMEGLLTQSHDATQDASQTFTMSNNADVKFPVITGESGESIRIARDSYISLMENQDRRMRRDTFRRLYSVYEQFSNTLAAVFSSDVKQAVFHTEVKKYVSGREYHLADNEMLELVYDGLVKTMWENVAGLHEYTRVRGNVLGVDKLRMYGLYIPMVVAADHHYTHEEAEAIILEGLGLLGEEYLPLLRQGFDNRWIGAYEDEGKHSGACSWGAYGGHPYVLLNFHGTLNDVFTLARGMGHSIHTWYSDKSQPLTYAGYKIFVAEVASTCNEALLIHHLLRKAGSKEEKAYLLNHFLESFRGALFCQTMFAEFEDMTHKRTASGESPTAESLCDAYRQLNTNYLGSAMTVDRQVDYEWERIPHFYTPFYVCQHATGFSAAVAINSCTMSREPGALEGCKKFLSGGCSMKPIDLLKLCGVGMSATRSVDEAFGFFGELFEEFKMCIHTNE